MLSSLMLLSFLQSIRLFHDKEIENLFLASYLKDIGFSIIPEEKYDESNLDDVDQKLFADHAEFSFDILEGRVPLSKNYLTIIRNHHFLNARLLEMINKSPRSNSQTNMLLGIESVMIGVFDMIVAMTSDRPYRKGMTLFQSLELIKKLMADEYPQEFKALVVFIKQFYKN
jgi:HD-GYP domain-containing protein (c-di-GMP phosphodiesterase class II)